MEELGLVFDIEEVDLPFCEGVIEDLLILADEPGVVEGGLEEDSLSENTSDARLEDRLESAD